MKKLFLLYSFCVMPVPLILGTLSLVGLCSVKFNGTSTSGFLPFILLIILIPALGAAMAGVNWAYLKLREKK
jgi:hypothetical protein